MANYRQIHTQIWRDNWFLDLEPDEKLLFIYLFSNDNSNLAGLYELHERIIQLETGLDKKRINEIVSKLEGDGKVFYRDGVVWIVNMQKYHSNAGEKVKRNIELIVESIPDCEVKRKYSIANGIELEDTLSVSEDTLSYSKSKSKLNSNSKTEEETEEVKSGAGDEKFSDVAKAYEDVCGVLNSVTADKLKLAYSEYEPSWIVDALKETAVQNKRSWAYTEAILKRWQKEGRNSKRAPVKPDERSADTFRKARQQMRQA